MLSLKQADLARQIGISASYLNLIEHNRRRIGGKLLLDIADALDVEPQALSEGAEAALLGSLREAALAADLSEEDAGRAEAFASRYPGWAEALAAGQRRIAALQRTVETLSDRMAHDPHLAASMHELLTTAAAVRSTAEILAGDEALERQWQVRFHANLDADSRRLAESAQALVSYLEQEKGPQAQRLSPQEEIEAYLAEHAYQFPALERGEDPAVLLSRTGQMSDAATFILRGVLDQVADDARLLPLATLEAALEEVPPDPVGLARRFGVPVAVVLRRLASVEAVGAGIVVCDRSGTVLFRKSVNGFSVPRFDTCCPLWPLFASLGSPGTVVRERIGQLGRGQVQFEAIAATDLQVAPDYNTPALARAVMLLLPVAPGDTSEPVRPVGATCRICPRAGCVARRDLSILAG